MVSLLIFNFCRIIEVFKINKIRFIEMIRWYNTGKCIGNLGYICILDFMDLIYSFSLLNTFCALLFVLNHTQVVEKIYNEKQVRLQLACTLRVVAFGVCFVLAPARAAYACQDVVIR